MNHKITDESVMTRKQGILVFTGHLTDNKNINETIDEMRQERTNKSLEDLKNTVSIHGDIVEPIDVEWEADSD